MKEQEVSRITAVNHGFTIGDTVRIPLFGKFNEDGVIVEGVFTVIGVDHDSFDVRQSTRFERWKTAFKMWGYKVWHATLELFDELRESWIRNRHA